jgi:hypothetical protein
MLSIPFPFSSFLIFLPYPELSACLASPLRLSLPSSLYFYCCLQNAWDGLTGNLIPRHWTCLYEMIGYDFWVLYMVEFSLFVIFSPLVLARERHHCIYRVVMGTVLFFPKLHQRRHGRRLVLQ